MALYSEETAKIYIIYAADSKKKDTLTKKYAVILLHNSFDNIFACISGSFRTYKQKASPCRIQNSNATVAQESHTQIAQF